MTEALTDLRVRGFSNDFNLKDIFTKEYNFQTNKFKIIETHRFENMSDPSENSVVYAIESIFTGIKGVLVNAYGVYSDSLASELVSKLIFNKK